VRKNGDVYWVVRIDPSGGKYRWAEIWGGYTRAGAAGGAAAQLAYSQAKRDMAHQLRKGLHDALAWTGLAALPTPAPVRPDDSRVGRDDDEGDDND
jgi:hypothetical protein